MTKRVRTNINQGFTLIELMIVVAIVGVLAVLAVYGVRRYIANAKTAEARQQLGAIGKAATISYENEKGSGAILTAGSASESTRALCLTSTSVPTSIASVKGTKYQSAASDWGGDATTGWKCLRFSVGQPQYFMYTYTRADTATFTATANGDLNGDGTSSAFTLAGSVQGGNVTIAPNIAETDPDE